MNQIRSHSVQLNDGHSIPILGIGTSTPNQVPKSKVEKAIELAIDVGYRHIDSAYLYLNEEEIGRAIQKKINSGTVMRDDIFYTSKLWSTFLRPELVQTALEMSLKKLQLSYVDLYIIHFPTAFKALEKCKDAGLTKSIGVSNFNHKQLEKILNKPGLKYKPVCNQVECHPYLNQSKMLEFCKSKDIVLVAYAALGSDPGKDWINKNNPALLEDPVLKAIAEKHGRTPAQVALRYQLQRGVVVLAKSFNEKRIKENFQVFDFQLTLEDMETLDGLNRNMRYFEAHEFSHHPNYPFLDGY
ncbi:prostaglandin F synthase 1-like isoform X4 [Choloepus didactylus]|uniref:prostaglandin F synthase 1-like isoform X4 n=1 Tax=Choloepus didactylus TaxID=27675 RepID=UPI0018A0353F|nr:prostaglandin F synthase 1-like isoform X4 [Choloepus didactylus]